MTLEPTCSVGLDPNSYSTPIAHHSLKTDSRKPKMDITSSDTRRSLVHRMGPEM